MCEKQTKLGDKIVGRHRNIDPYRNIPESPVLRCGIILILQHFSERMPIFRHLELLIKTKVILSTVKENDTVRVHYTGTTDDGATFDSSRDRNEPLEFTMGMGQLIPGFEKAVAGMKVGDSTKIRIPAEEAYGEAREEMIVEVERSKFPSDITPEVGMQLQVQQPNGQPMPVAVKAVTETHVTLDANHPLAGQALNFDIELVEIVD